MHPTKNQSDWTSLGECNRLGHADLHLSQPRLLPTNLLNFLRDLLKELGEYLKGFRIQSGTPSKNVVPVFGILSTHFPGATITHKDIVYSEKSPPASKDIVYSEKSPPASFDETEALCTEVDRITGHQGNSTPLTLTPAEMEKVLAEVDAVLKRS